jgi:putative transposase
VDRESVDRESVDRESVDREGKRKENHLMLVQRAYNTELALNNAHVTTCKRHAGAARYAYNWGLACRLQEAYKATGTSPSAIDLHRALNALKKTNLPWMYEVSKCAPQEAWRNLDHAFPHVFRRIKRKQQGQWRGKMGFPKPTSKKRGLGSFWLTGSIVVFSDAMQLPRLGRLGRLRRLRRLRLKERGYWPRGGVKIQSATVSEEGGHG